MNWYLPITMSTGVKVTVGFNARGIAIVGALTQGEGLALLCCGSCAIGVLVGDDHNLIHT